jgi:indolepyruvate ferredoxin oxidoreductase alpha subunit
VNDPDASVGCGMCMKVGCPAIIKTETGVRIDPTQCVGCGMCTQLCHFGALKAAE